MISLICDRCSKMYQTDRITQLCGPCQAANHLFAARPLTRLEIAYAGNLAHALWRSHQGYVPRWRGDI